MIVLPIFVLHPPIDFFVKFHDAKKNWLNNCSTEKRRRKRQNCKVNLFFSFFFNIKIPISFVLVPSLKAVVCEFNNIFSAYGTPGVTV